MSEIPTGRPALEITLDGVTIAVTTDGMVLADRNRPPEVLDRLAAKGLLLYEAIGPGLGGYRYPLGGRTAPRHRIVMLIRGKSVFAPDTRDVSYVRLDAVDFEAALLTAVQSFAFRDELLAAVAALYPQQLAQLGREWNGWDITLREHTFYDWAILPPDYDGPRRDELTLEEIAVAKASAEAVSP